MVIGMPQGGRRDTLAAPFRIPVAPGKNAYDIFETALAAVVPGGRGYKHVKRTGELVLLVH